MPFRIETHDDDLQAALRRIATEQIDRALREIEHPDLSLAERVHQARKRCKKLRGLIRLVRPVMGGYKRENAALRDAARRLSGMRDTQTLIATYDAVCEQFADEIDRRAFGPIRAKLTRDAKAAAADPELAVRCDAFRDAMQAVRARASVWTLEDEDFEAMAAGLRKTYSRARKRMKCARSDGGDATMHEWRKRVKYHWYHARLLSPVYPAMMAPWAEEADRLSDLLGDHHDLAVFEARLARTPEAFGDATSLAAFRALLGKRKAMLADRALVSGRMLLAEEPDALVGRWARYLSLWRAGTA
ncbi:CHAD domain-containing protein [uncultured Jannaschia sp.]|uniref:CHAD domain-containing protein n=1 Tax=uncultured Jannaschia sp. TaxID=293347 RepID=UPI002611E7D1|nr:CHAD domain-containing protein [uncultured Jannaschia sp.]